MPRSRFPRRNKIAMGCDLDKNIKYKQIVNFKPYCYWYSLGDDWYKFWYEKELMGVVRNQVVCEIKIKRNMFTTLEKKEKGKILVIDSLEDVDEMNKKYSKVMKSLSMRLIDFNEVAKTYSGIEFRNYHKINKEIRTNRFKSLPRNSFLKRYSWYLTIDVNSGCVWDLDIIEVEKIGKLKDFVK